MDIAENFQTTQGTHGSGGDKCATRQVEDVIAKRLRASYGRITSFKAE